MATPRAVVSSVLGDYLPVGVTLVPYSRQIDSPSSSTVMIRIDDVAPSKAASGVRDYQFALVCIAARTVAGGADDELDGLLEDVLYAIEQASADGITWTSAKRAVYNESNPAYEVAISVAVAKNQE